MPAWSPTAPMSPFPCPFLVSVPKQTGSWGFLGCSFGRGPWLSLWVSALLFGICAFSPAKPFPALSQGYPACL